MWIFNRKGPSGFSYSSKSPMESTALVSLPLRRIVNVSSRLHRLAYSKGIQFDKINDPKSYNIIGGYSQSKLANILHANELTRRLKEDGVEITAYSLHPGKITTNNFCYMRVVDGLVSTLEKFIFKNA
nr:short-chain dehydrogenase TIC 32, chloroplastic-like [Nicotiana tomentosiformis]